MDRLKLKRVLARLDGLFLGVIEEVPGINRHCMTAQIDPAFVAGSAKVRKTSQPTPIYEFFSTTQPEPAAIDLLFSSQHMYDICKLQQNIVIRRVTNMEKKRHGRTVLEVAVQSGTGSVKMALKCIATDKKTQFRKGVVTLTQDEAVKTDTLPQEIKLLFCRKYAHGRMFLNDELRTYEVILMEMLCEEEIQIKMLHAIAGQGAYPADTAYTWWSAAIAKVLMLHRAGFVHGDAHLANFLWSSQIGGEIKMIDPERMKFSKQLSQHEWTISKLNDIYHLLFNNVCFIFLLTNKYDMVSIDWVSLHKRLDKINTILIGQSKTGFLLNDVVISDPSMMFYDDGKKKYVSEAIETCKRTNPEQYSRLPSIDTDQFLEGLSDPILLKKTMFYLIAQIKRASTFQIEDIDLQVPDSRIQQPRNTQQPNNLPPLQPPQQNTIPQQQNTFPQQQNTFPPQNTIPQQQNTILPLTLAGNQIFFRPDAEFYPLYYNVVGDTGRVYTNVNGAFKPYDGPGILLFSLVKNQMYSAYNKGNLLYICVSGSTLISGSMETGSFKPFQKFDLRKSPPELTYTDI
jgi:hypothetical protein